MSEAADTAPPAAEAPSAKTWKPPNRPPRAVAVAVLAGASAVGLVLAAWRLPPFQGSIEVTDNAYVRGRTTAIAPQVSGYVVEVRAHDYQTVEAGQVLVRVDDGVYRARVEQAKANLDAAIAALANSAQARAARTASLEGERADIANAEAQLVRAQGDMNRDDDLVRDGSVSVREHDQSLAALRAAEAKVRQSRAASEVVRQDIRTVDVDRRRLRANVEAARAQLALAQIDLDHTVIRAPEAGQLGEVGVRLGQYVTNGAQLVSLIPGDRWVIANFKETQMHRMSPGDRASFTIDALAGARLPGRVEALSPGAGSEFSVLKPDNATGNFVKVPQRIGVRIVLEPNQPNAARLRPGMSVEVRVDTASRAAG